MLEHDRTDASEGREFNQTGGLSECFVCHFWCFLE